MSSTLDIFQKSFGLLKNRNKFFFRSLVSNDFQQANKLVLLYLTQSPTCKGFNFPIKEAEVISKWYLSNYLCNGVSFGAFEQDTQNMAAVMLLNQRNYGSHFMPTRYPKEYAMKLRLQSVLEGESISAKPSELGSFLDGVLVLVDPKYFGYRLAPEMQLLALEFGKNLECLEIRSIVSSDRSLRAALKSGFKVKSLIKLSEYVDSRLGIKPYDDAKPPNDNYYYVFHKINT